MLRSRQNIAAIGQICVRIGGRQGPGDRPWLGSDGELDTLDDGSVARGQINLANERSAAGCVTGNRNRRIVGLACAGKSAEAGADNSHDNRGDFDAHPCVFRIDRSEAREILNNPVS